MISSTVLLTAAVIFACWNMMLATASSKLPLFKRFKANANVASGSIDKIVTDISQFPNLTSAYLYEAIRRNRLDILDSLVEKFNTHQQTEPSANILDLEYGGMHLLSVAILHQHMDMVKWMVDNGADINVGDANTQKTPLYYAFELGMSSIVNLLIEKGANVRAKDSRNLSCLHYACISGDLDLVHLAILLDMDLDVIDLNRNASLHYACESGNEGIVRILIEKNANVNALGQYNMTPLHIACKSGNEDIVHMLIEHGANVNALGQYNMTSLHYACDSRNEVIMNMLIKHGANVNALNEWNTTSLHYACDSGNEVIMDMLIKHGANVNALNKSNWTPLHYACKSGNEGTVSILIEKNANVNALNESNRTPLHYACESGNVAIVGMLIKNGANVNALNKSNVTPLHIACGSGSEDIVNMLIENGASMNALDVDNKIPLHYACGSGNEGIMQILIKHGANVHVLDVCNITSLHYACESGNQATLDMLIKHGANVNALATNKTTPLHRACGAGNEGIVRILIEKNASVNAINTWDMTPLRHACKSGNMRIVHTLIKSGAKVIDEANDYMSLLQNAFIFGNEASVRYFFDHAEDLNLDDSILKDASLLNALKYRRYVVASLLIEHGSNFGSIKSQWLGSNFEKKIEFFLTNMHLFSQLNRIEQNTTLVESNYDSALNINLPDHVIGSRLGCIFILFSLNVLEDIKRAYDQQNIGYFKFMFSQARLFLERKWPCNGQDPKLVSILGQVFRTVFKNVNFNKMSSKIDESCELLTGPSGFIYGKDAQQWIQRYLKYPWALIEAIKTSPELVSAMLQHVILQVCQSDSLQKGLNTS